MTRGSLGMYEHLVAAPSPQLHVPGVMDVATPQYGYLIVFPGTRHL